MNDPRHFPSGVADRGETEKASSDNEAGFLRTMRRLLHKALAIASPDHTALPTDSLTAETIVQPASSDETADETATETDIQLQQLENRIGYRFNDPLLLRRAVTHRSFANEQTDPRPAHNEALEFLGDAVLEFLISSWLLELHPTLNEGPLSKMRAYAVSAANLQKHAARLQLGSYLLLNRGEEKTGGRHKVALQVDAYEALIAGIYLDGGIEAARDFVRREFAGTFAEIDPQNLTKMDYKTALQERLQSLGLPTPRYDILERQGPDHRRVFQVALSVKDHRLATGEGTTIKSAHQAAAKEALLSLDREIGNLVE